LIVGRYKKLSALYVLFIAIYLGQTLWTAADKTTMSRYRIDATQLKLLSLTVVIPYVVIWLVAFVGYLRLRSYTKLIQASKDGAAFDLIAQGVFWLTLWLPLSTIVDGLFSHYYTSHASSTGNLVRIDNYFNLAILLFAMAWINRGSLKLLGLIKKPTFSQSQTLVLCYIAFSALYVLLTLHDPARQSPTKSVTVASYYESDWLLVPTLVIPRLIMWFLGLQAVRNIYLYQEKVKGSLYKAALSNLAQGLAGVVIVTIVLRCVQSLSSPLSKAGLGLLLAIVYVLLIIISIGYVLLAKGAKNLQKLEEL
jgi:hypothetical protein